MLDPQRLRAVVRQKQLRLRRLRRLLRLLWPEHGVSQATLYYYYSILIYYYTTHSKQQNTPPPIRFPHNLTVRHIQSQVCGDRGGGASRCQPPTTLVAGGFYDGGDPRALGSHLDSRTLGLLGRIVALYVYDCSSTLYQIH